MTAIKTATIDTSKRIFVLSDIHANLPALESVTPLIRADDIVVCLGDMVGYYTEPNEVCDFIRARADFAIVGNHDLYCLDQIPFKQENEEKYRVHDTRAALNDINTRWLQSLPHQIILTLSAPVIFKIKDNDIEIKHIHMAHGAPSNIETYIYPDKPLPDDCCATETLLLLGHTHHPMLRAETFGAVLNAGSVGQPRDWNPKPSFAIIDLAAASMSHERSIYDWNHYANVLAARGFHSDSISLLTRIRS